MPSEAKAAAVEQLKQVLEGASSIYLTDFTGMPVEMMSNLRKKCREADVEYRVVKDSLTRLAAERAGVMEVVEFLEGPIALALGHSDQLAPARVLSEFARAHKLPRMKAALVEGRIFAENEVKTLAALPSRDILLGQFAAGLKFPLMGFAGVINQVMWKMVATLEAVAKAMEEQGPEEPHVAAADASKAEADSGEVKAEEEAGAAETAGSDEGGEGAAETAAETAAADSDRKEDGPEADGASDERGDD